MTALEIILYPFLLWYGVNIMLLLIGVIIQDKTYIEVSLRNMGLSYIVKRLNKNEDD